MKLALFFGLSLLATQSFAESRVVYGVDNRLDIFETTDQFLVDLSSSTAAMIANSRITDLGDGSYSIRGSSLGSMQSLCKDEKFYNQPTPANCSGFLVAPDLFVTAGHCIKSASDCRNSSWVFNFAVSDASGKVNTILKDDVYKCASIVDRKYTGDQNDYAMIKLDREVVGRSPLSVRTSGVIPSDATLVMIGHPSGLPTKIAPGAKVRENINPLFFLANTDSFGGNSGSAVINQSTGDVEGILVRGEPDYAYDGASGCYRVKVCEEYGCRGEGVTRITNIAPLMDLVKNY